MLRGWIRFNTCVCVIIYITIDPRSGLCKKDLSFLSLTDTKDGMVRTSTAAAPYKINSNNYKFIII